MRITYSKLFACAAFFVMFSFPFSCQAAQTESGGESSDQQISEFNLSASGEKGKKLWEISGKTADVLTDVVKLDNITANMYGDEEDVNLTADRGDFNKKEGKVHLEDNVVITTTGGARLTTDTMDWDRKNQLVSTNDKVNIVKDGMVTTASGAKGEPTLKKVTLEKDVTVNIDAAAQGAKPQGKTAAEENKIIITCDGPLTVDYEKNIATFNNNVKVLSDSAEIDSDKMDIYFNKTSKPETPAEGETKSPALMGNKIDKIVARGNVKITRGENVSYSDEAVYSGIDKKITLSGRPKLVIFSAEDLSEVR